MTVLTNDLTNEQIEEFLASKENDEIFVNVGFKDILDTINAEYVDDAIKASLRSYLENAINDFNKNAAQQERAEQDKLTSEDLSAIPDVTAYLELSEEDQAKTNDNLKKLLLARLEDVKKGAVVSPLVADDLVNLAAQLGLDTDEVKKTIETIIFKTYDLNNQAENGEQVTNPNDYIVVDRNDTYLASLFDEENGIWKDEGLTPANNIINSLEVTDDEDASADNSELFRQAIENDVHAKLLTSKEFSDKVAAVEAADAENKAAAEAELKKYLIDEINAQAEASAFQMLMQERLAQNPQTLRDKITKLFKRGKNEIDTQSRNVASQVLVTLEGIKSGSKKLSVSFNSFMAQMADKEQSWQEKLKALEARGIGLRNAQSLVNKADEFNKAMEEAHPKWKYFQMAAKVVRKAAPALALSSATMLAAGTGFAIPAAVAYGAYRIKQGMKPLFEEYRKQKQSNPDTKFTDVIKKNKIKAGRAILGIFGAGLSAFSAFGVDAAIARVAFGVAGSGLSVYTAVSTQNDKEAKGWQKGLAWFGAFASSAMAAVGISKAFGGNHLDDVANPTTTGNAANTPDVTETPAVANVNPVDSALTNKGISQDEIAHMSEEEKKALLDAMKENAVNGDDMTNTLLADVTNLDDNKARDYLKLFIGEDKVNALSQAEVDKLLTEKVEDYAILDGDHINTQLLDEHFAKLAEIDKLPDNFVEYADFNEAKSLAYATRILGQDQMDKLREAYDNGQFRGMEDKISFARLADVYARSAGFPAVKGGRDVITKILEFSECDESKKIYIPTAEEMAALHKTVNSFEYVNGSKTVEVVDRYGNICEQKIGRYGEYVGDGHDGLRNTRILTEARSEKDCPDIKTTIKTKDSGVYCHECQEPALRVEPVPEPRPQVEPLKPVPVKITIPTINPPENIHPTVPVDDPQLNPDLTGHENAAWIKRDYGSEVRHEGGYNSNGTFDTVGADNQTVWLHRNDEGKIEIYMKPDNNVDVQHVSTEDPCYVGHVAYFTGDLDENGDLVGRSARAMVVDGDGKFREVKINPNKIDPEIMQSYKEHGLINDKDESTNLNSRTNLANLKIKTLQERSNVGGNSQSHVATETNETSDKGNNTLTATQIASQQTRTM